MDQVLEYGQTPWDNLSRKELLRQVQTMYDALVSARSVMQLTSRSGNPFWQPDGTGYVGLAKAIIALDSVHEKFNNEEIYRSFFRYASDLLFPGLSRFNWHVCSKCGDMWSADSYGAYVGQQCSILPSWDAGKVCDGVLRLLEWDDLRPKPRQ